MYISNAPSGRKKNFWCSLLVNFRSATHICKNRYCTSVSGTPEVHWTSRTEFLDASSLIGPFLILIISLAAYFQFADFSAPPAVCPAAVQFPLCFYFLWIIFKNSYCSDGGTEKSVTNFRLLGEESGFLFPYFILNYSTVHTNYQFTP